MPKHLGARPAVAAPEPRAQRAQRLVAESALDERLQVEVGASVAAWAAQRHGVSRRDVLPDGADDNRGMHAESVPYGRCVGAVPPDPCYAQAMPRRISNPSDYREALCARVALAREQSGLSTDYVARASGVSRDPYAPWESRALLPHHLVVPFCALVGVDPVWLLARY